MSSNDKHKLYQLVMSLLLNISYNYVDLGYDSYTYLLSMDMTNTAALWRCFARERDGNKAE